MRPFFLSLLFVALAVTATGQVSRRPVPPDVVISDWSWSQTYKRGDNDLSLPTRVGETTTVDKHAKSRQVAPGQVAFGNTLPIPKDPFDDNQRVENNRQDEYLYKMVVENKGEKKINAIVWEYVFYDPIKRTIISIHQFSSKVTVKPGERRKISRTSLRRPTQVVRVEAAALPDIEQVIIKRVEYSDGSVWVQ